MGKCCRKHPPCKDCPKRGPRKKKGVAGDERPIRFFRN